MATAKDKLCLAIRVPLRPVHLAAFDLWDREGHALFGEMLHALR
jgi:hypothetical protein